MTSRASQTRPDSRGPLPFLPPRSAALVEQCGELRGRRLSRVEAPNQSVGRARARSIVSRSVAGAGAAIASVSGGVTTTISAYAVSIKRQSWARAGVNIDIGGRLRCRQQVRYASPGGRRGAARGEASFPGPKFPILLSRAQRGCSRGPAIGRFATRSARSPPLYLDRSARAREPAGCFHLNYSPLQRLPRARAEFEVIVLINVAQAR